MFVFTCLFFFVSPSGWWCPALWMPLFTCFPSSGPLSGWWRPALWMCLVTCLPSLSPFICLPSFVSRAVYWYLALRMSFACFLLSLIMCLWPRVSQSIHLPINLSPNQQPACVVMSGSFACSPLCVFHHLSLTFCPVLHLSPKSFVSNPMSALVVVSCSSFIVILFVCRASLFFTHFVSSCCPKIIHVPPWFSAFYHLAPACLLPCLPPVVSYTKAVAKRNETVRHEKTACDSLSSELTWIKNRQHQELAQPKSCADAAIDME